MKTKIVVIGAAVLLAGAVALRASDLSSTDTQYNHVNLNENDYTSDELYRSWEGSIEAFAAGTISERKNYDSGPYVLHHHRANVGGGLGLEYFFCKYVGVEAEGIAVTDTHDFVNSTGGNLVLRLPIGNTGLAPYIFGGAGHNFNPTSGTYGDFGAGLEFRFTHQFGIFVDGRLVTSDNAGNYGMGRLGAKFNF